MQQLVVVMFVSDAGSSSGVRHPARVQVRIVEFSSWSEP
jgi:hypothetical protein